MKMIFHERHEQDDHDAGMMTQDLETSIYSRLIDDPVIIHCNHVPIKNVNRLLGKTVNFLASQ